MRRHHKYSALLFWLWFGISLILADSSLSPNPGDFSSGLCLDWAGKGLTHGAGSSLKGWRKGEKEEQTTEMERKIRRKRDKEHKHSCWFLSRSQFEMNAPDFILWFP